MAFTDHHSSTLLVIPGPGDLIRGLKKWIKRRQDRRKIEILLKQEDWVLRDMGITRGDVREALAAKPNPSMHLRALAARRRFWARQSEKI